MEDKIFLLLMVVLATVNGETTTTTSPLPLIDLIEKLQEGSSPTFSATPAGSTQEDLLFNFGGGNDVAVGKDSAQSDSTLVDPLLIFGSILAEDLEKSLNESSSSNEGANTGVNYFPVTPEKPTSISSTFEKPIIAVATTGEEPMASASNDQIDVRRPDNSNFGLPSTTGRGFEETKATTNIFSSPFPYEPKIEEPKKENSPVLQLTEGGYQRPFQPADQERNKQQTSKFESGSEQTETVETPNSNLNNAQREGRARIPLQSPYSSVYQSPFGFSNEPVFRHPLESQINGMRTPNSPIQNSFYNTQPDFNQRQFSQLTNAGDFPLQFTVQTGPRVPMQNPAYLFSNPFQSPPSQTFPGNNPGQIPSYFQQSAPNGYSNFENSADSPNSEYAALFGNVPPMSQHFPDRSNFYDSSPNFGRNIFTEPHLNFMPSFPNGNDGIQYSPRLHNYPLPGRQMPIENRNPQLQSSISPNEEKQMEEVNESRKQNGPSLPFGTRIPQQNSGPARSDSEKQNDVYLRYPVEAGYGMEENLPTQNDTLKRPLENDAADQTFPFFNDPRKFNIFNNNDPYKIALENVQRGYPSVMNRETEGNNKTNEFPIEQRIREFPLNSNVLRPESPTQIFRPFPERPYSERHPELTNSPVYVNSNPFESTSVFHDNNYHHFFPNPSFKQSNKIPICAEKTNASMCFEDSEYPSNELMYALNSDSYVIERLAPPNQHLDDISLVEQNTTENLQGEDKYICQSDIKYGRPLRAKNVKGTWKVIVNMDKSVGRGKFVQPVRLEVCRGAGDPCNYIQIKTACVQKYSLQRLLSWSPEKGVHNDVYKLPVACSCQILDTPV